MDREILFRGKHVFAGIETWFYGDLIHEKDKTAIYRCGERLYYVNPDTVGRFTNLTDKNGKMIFEGDIVKYKDDDDIAIVRFNTDYAMFDMQTLEDEIRNFESTWSGELEIIGNIFDNPNLMEVE